MASHPLVTAAGTAYANGLRFVYVGNVADEFSQLSHTRCPECQEVVVRRFNYATQENMLKDGRCAGCGTVIPGLY